MIVSRPNILFFLLLFFYAKMLTGQEKEVVRGNSQWVQYYNQTRINEKWNLLFDGGYRWADTFKEPSQYIIRAGLSYNIGSNIHVAAGFAHLGFYTSNELVRTEYRPYQEVGFKTLFDKITLTHRLRIEERFFRQQTISEFANANSFNFRFRYMFLLNIPLKKFNDDPQKELFLNLGDEIFLNAGKEVVNDVFDQNRFLVSPTYKMNEHLSLALTWNYNFSGLKRAGTYTALNVFWLQIKHNLDLRKKANIP